MEKHKGNLDQARTVLEHAVRIKQAVELENRVQEVEELLAARGITP